MAADVEVAQQKLVGCWKTAPDDGWSLDRYGEVVIVLQADGTLEYRIRGDGKTQIVKLTYRIDGCHLITDQPSSPSEEIARFGFTDEGRLFLEDNDGFRSYYVRISCGDVPGMSGSLLM